MFLQYFLECKSLQRDIFPFPRGGGIPYNGLYGKAPKERVTGVPFQRVKGYERRTLLRFLEQTHRKEMQLFSLMWVCKRGTTFYGRYMKGVEPPCIRPGAHGLLIRLCRPPPPYPVLVWVNWWVIHRWLVDLQHWLSQYEVWHSLMFSCTLCGTNQIEPTLRRVLTYQWKTCF